MRIYIKKAIFFFFIISFFHPSFSQPKFPPERPKLVVGIIIDGFRYDYIQRYWDKFSENGFKKLVNSGTFFQNHQNQQIINESAVCYANIATGAYASAHGIVDIDWYDRLKEDVTNSTVDTRLNSINGTTDAEKYSSLMVLASTLSDELSYSSNHQSKTIAIGLNAYAPTILAGHSGASAYWLDFQTGNWTSSKFFTDSIPGWLKDFNAKKLADIYLAKNWTPLLDIKSYTESINDNNDYERGFGRFHKEFPHELSKLANPQKKYEILADCPFGNNYTEDMAIHAIIEENLGKDDNPDLLYVAFTAGDGVASRFHPLSIENEDFYLRLDKDIAHFIEFIESEVGIENTLIFLTGTHGMALPPEYMALQHFDVDYFDASKIIGILKSYLKAIYGKGEWISYYNHQQLYLNRELIRKSGFSLADFQHSITEFLVQVGGVSHAVGSLALESGDFSTGYFKKIQNSYHQKRSADIFIDLSPGWVEKPYYRDEQRMYSFNSTYQYDVHVPLIWYGWKVKRKRINTPSEPIDIAPTIANFLMTSWPNAAQGEPLNDIILQDKKP
jgi:predicted AlkP superfamily pyrophosphatase or phosphodiesterase